MWCHSDFKVLKTKWYRQFTGLLSCLVKSSLGTRLSEVYNFHCSGAGDLRTKMKESLESESTTGTAELESSASCGGTVWEIDLSSFKTGKNSRQPHSKEAPPAKSSVFSRPLQPKQLVKVTLPPNEPSTSPAPTLMRTPQDMELRKVLDLRRWYVQWKWWVEWKCVKFNSVSMSMVVFQWLFSWLLHKWRGRLSVTNLLMFRLNAPVALMTMGAFSLNTSKLFSELKLVTDNLPLCVYGSICHSKSA